MRNRVRLVVFQGAGGEAAALGVRFRGVRFRGVALDARIIFFIFWIKRWDLDRVPCCAQLLLQDKKKNR
jgi:hypothetical protein